MTSRRKGGLRGKVKKKDENENSLPKLKRECTVDLEKLNIERKDHSYVDWIDSRVDMGLKRKLSTEESEPVSKKSKPSTTKAGKSLDAKIKSEPAAKKNIVGTKKGNAVGKKEDQIFIDFELGRSRRISEINTLLRSSGKTKQFSSLPPK